MRDVLREMVEKQREIEHVSGLRSGRYMVNGKPAHCFVSETSVRVSYDDGGFTSAYHDTFMKWGATPITD